MAETDTKVLTVPVLSAWIDQEEELNRLTREALADVDADRVIDHQIVQAWANSLCTDTPLPIRDYEAVGDLDWNADKPGKHVSGHVRMNSRRRKYSALRAKMSPEARARAEKKTRQLMQEMPLQELRQEGREINKENL